MDTAVVLDVMKSGTPINLEPRVERELLRRGARIRRGGYLAVPIAFVLAKNRLFLAVAVPAQGVNLNIGDEVDLRDKSKIIAWARIGYDALTSIAKSELENALDKLIEEREKDFVDFFNRAGPITTRLHSLELLPGIGKKHMWDIIEQRRRPFTSYADIKERVPLLPDPKKSIKERILKELQGGEKYYLFVLPPRRA